MAAGEKCEGMHVMVAEERAVRAVDAAMREVENKGEIAATIVKVGWPRG